MLARMDTITGSRQGSANVAEAALEAWRVAGEPAEVVEWAVVAGKLGLGSTRAIASAVMVPRVMEIECFLETNEDLRDVRRDLSILASEGWRVRALMPVAWLGAAHEALRGLDLHLQGWWTTQERGVKFSSPEAP